MFILSDPRANRPEQEKGMVAATGGLAVTAMDVGVAFWS